MIPRSPNLKRQILTIPNLLSLFRLCLIPVCVWLYCVRHDYIATTLVLILSGLTDVVDGLIARKFHMVSDVGKILDPVADKLTQASMLFCLLSRFRNMIVPLLLMVVKEIFSAISGWLVIRKTGQVQGALWHGKAATVLLYAMMVIHLLWVNIPSVVSTLLIGLCSTAIILSFVLYGIRNLQLIRQPG